MAEEKLKIPRSTVAYLHQLRKSAAVNMMGAAPYLVRDLGLDKREADKIACAFVFGNFEEVA